MHRVEQQHALRRGEHDGAVPLSVRLPLPTGPCAGALEEIVRAATFRKEAKIARADRQMSLLMPDVGHQLHALYTKLRQGIAAMPP
ncbi:hypothetical protein, partial [Streptomyces sp. NPDC002346]